MFKGLSQLGSKLAETRFPEEQERPGKKHSTTRTNKDITLSIVFLRIAIWLAVLSDSRLDSRSFIFLETRQASDRTSCGKSASRASSRPVRCKYFRIIPETTDRNAQYFRAGRQEFCEDISIYRRRYHSYRIWIIHLC